MALDLLLYGDIRFGFPKPKKTVAEVNHLYLLFLNEDQEVDTKVSIGKVLDMVVEFTVSAYCYVGDWFNGQSHGFGVQSCDGRSSFVRVSILCQT